MSQSFTREAALRLLRVSERQLKSWERQKLIEPVAVYSFRELLALRTLIKLRESKVPAQQIRRAVQALTKKLRGVEDPLTELKLYADGKKIRVELEGRAMEAESGQLLLDFDPGELSRLLEFRPKENPRAERDQRQAAEHWFQRGLDELLLLPTLQLFFGNVEQTASRFASERLTRCAAGHARILTGLIERNRGDACGACLYAIYCIGCGDAAKSQHRDAHGAHRLHETFDSARFEAGSLRAWRKHRPKDGIVSALVLCGAHVIESVAGNSN